MKKKENIAFDESYAYSRAPRFSEDFDEESAQSGEYGSSLSGKERFLDSLQRYFGNCQVMMATSLSHLRNPSTLIVIFILIAVYILLGVAGTVEFSFYSKNVVQYINTNLDIIVNALLGYFYGPVTCAIAVTLCCIVRIITNRSIFFIGYVIGACVAGFIHGFILYRLKPVWFGTRWRGFFKNLLVRVAETRFCVSVFVNILLMSLIYRIFIDYPIVEYLKNYSKSGVPLNTPYEFLRVFAVSIIFETLVIFVALAVINFIVAKAFPNQFEQPSIIINDKGELLSAEEDMMNDMDFE